MNTNCFRNLWERIRHRVSDSFSMNKKLYFFYFFVVILGAVVGVLSARSIVKDVDLEIENCIDLILYENAGVFTHFKSELLTLIIIYALCVIGTLFYPAVICLFGVCALIAFRVFRIGLCLIFIGGITNILCGVLFYVVFYSLFFFLLSYTVVRVAFVSGRYGCGCIRLYDAIRIVTPSYLFCVSILLIYSVTTSLLISIFAI